MSTIKNINVYNAEMKKSLLDKAFFMDKIKTDVIVDFGCADGMLMKFMNEMFPEYSYIGYDINEEELALAKNNVPFAHLFSDWEQLEKFISQYSHKTVVLNSLIHEIYSYCSKDEIDLFWKRVFSFDTVVIRDMSLSRSATKKSDVISAVNVRHKADTKQLNEFESVWGSIDYNPNLIHYLTKYRYKINWDREVKENYFPILFEDLIGLIPTNYHIEHFEHYILPFIRNDILNKFGVVLNDNTHVKLILNKR